MIKITHESPFLFCLPFVSFNPRTGCQPTAARRTLTANDGPNTRQNRRRTPPNAPAESTGAALEVPSVSDEQIRQKVIDIVCEHLAVNKDQVTDKTSFIEDIGADSLDIVELVMELEEEFDIQIPDDQAEKIKTVGEAVEHIKNAVRTKDTDGGAKA